MFSSSLLHKIKLDSGVSFYSSLITLTKENGSPLPNPEQYRNVIIAFQYATIIRLNISFSINRLY